MEKEMERNIAEKIDMIKTLLNFSDETFEKMYCVKKEQGIKNILNTIINELEEAEK